MQSFFFSDKISDSISDKYLNLTWFLLTSIFIQTKWKPRKRQFSEVFCKELDWIGLNKFTVLRFRNRVFPAIPAYKIPFPTFFRQNCLLNVGRHDIMNLSEEERLLLFNCNIQFSKALFFSSLLWRYVPHTHTTCSAGRHFAVSSSSMRRKSYWKRHVADHGAFCLRELFRRGKILT